MEKRRGARAPQTALGTPRACEVHQRQAQDDEVLGGGTRAEGGAPSLRPAKAKAILPTEYPFWRLQNDHIWIFKALRPLRQLIKGREDPKKSDLLKDHAEGGFSAPMTLRRGHTQLGW